MILELLKNKACPLSLLSTTDTGLTQRIPSADKGWIAYIKTSSFLKHTDNFCIFLDMLSPCTEILIESSHQRKHITDVINT